MVLVAKIDNLWKCQGRKIAKRLGHEVAIGVKYMNVSSNHNQNQRLFVAIQIDSIQDPMRESTIEHRKKKGI